jgi:uncharacterized heparinase superfamily protein
MRDSCVFEFLNTTRTVSSREDWVAAEVSRLWRYNLHYFDDLNAAGRRNRLQWHVDLVNRWINENPPGIGDGWDPYPLSLRIVNWIKWALGEGRLSVEALQSLAVQVRWLSTRIEYQVLGNHLLANAKALVFAGRFFTGVEAERWFAMGMRIFESELDEQILFDGAHFELSPMYHSIVVEDVLDLVNLLHAFATPVPVFVADRIPAMLTWLRAMLHPDGGFGFFNDAAFGIAPEPAELFAYASRLGFAVPGDPDEGLTVLEASGYYRVQDRDICLICDCGAIGPDYLPGHAHADSLSFELSIGGVRVFANSGTSVYGASAERLRQRGTAAHNTVAIDGCDSSEVWSGFRVARRAQVCVSDASRSGPVTIAATHNGYARLQGRPIHSRRWTVDSGVISITDKVHGICREACGYFHLTPAIGVNRIAINEVCLTAHGQRIANVSVDGAAELRVVESTWHPEFGKSMPAKTLVAPFEHDEVLTRIRTL